MTEIAALWRASWLDASSYRLRMLFTLLGLVLSALPFYFVAQALQGVMASSIQQEGGQYFAFVVVGMVTFAFMRTAITALPEELNTAISTGTLEALLGTPAKLPMLLAGLVAYAFTWTAIRSVTLVAFALAMGMHLVWSRLLLGLGVLVLVVAVHLAFGILGASLILAFRATGPVQNLILWVSTMLGGIYYPTEVIPEWLRGVTAFVPMTYGARALRKVLLEQDFTWTAVAWDVGALTCIGVVLGAVSLLAFAWALRYAREAGTLAQY